MHASAHPSHHRVLLPIGAAADTALRVVDAPVRLAATSCAQGFGAALERCSGTSADRNALQHCAGHGASALMDDTSVLIRTQI